MTPWDRIVTKVGFWVASLTGFLFIWLKYFADKPDPFSLSHPYQNIVMATHVVLSPLLLFGVGMIWNSHVLKMWRSSGVAELRQSGLVMLFLFFPMVASGYLYQCSADEALRAFWKWTHTGVSSVWALVGAWHLLKTNTST